MKQMLPDSVYAQHYHILKLRPQEMRFKRYIYIYINKNQRSVLYGERFATYNGQTWGIRVHFVYIGDLNHTVVKRQK